MRRSILISIGLLASMPLITHAQMFGAGVYAGFQPCGYPYGMAGGSSSEEDELDALKKDETEKKKELKEAERQVTARKKLVSEYKKWIIKRLGQERTEVIEEYYKRKPSRDTAGDIVDPRCEAGAPSGGGVPGSMAPVASAQTASSGAVPAVVQGSQVAQGPQRVRAEKFCLKGENLLARYAQEDIKLLCRYSWEATSKSSEQSDTKLCESGMDRLREALDKLSEAEKSRDEARVAFETAKA